MTGDKSPFLSVKVAFQFSQASSLDCDCTYLPDTHGGAAEIASSKHSRAIVSVASDWSMCKHRGRSCWCTLRRLCNKSESLTSLHQADKELRLLPHSICHDVHSQKVVMQDRLIDGSIEVQRHEVKGPQLLYRHEPTMLRITLLLCDLGH